MERTGAGKEAIEGKEHIGYIVDRAGFETFLKYIMAGVELPDKAEVAARRKTRVFARFNAQKHLAFVAV